MLDCCFCAIGCSKVSTKEDTFSVGLSQPEMIGLLTGKGFWIFFKRVEDLNRWAEGLRKPYFQCRVVDVIWLTFVCVFFTIGACRGL